MGGLQKVAIKGTWNLFLSEKRKNIAIYILGIMLYKFGLEAFNGSIVALATNRWDAVEQIDRPFERLDLLTGLNQTCQCIGSILIAPLIKRYHEYFDHIYQERGN